MSVGCSCAFSVMGYIGSGSGGGGVGCILSQWDNVNRDVFKVDIWHRVSAALLVAIRM